MGRTGYTSGQILACAVLCWATLQAAASITTEAVPEYGVLLAAMQDTRHAAEEEENAEGADKKEKSAAVEDDQGIRDITPLKKEKISVAEAMAVDLAIPGGGALYYKDYYFGIGFAALKIAGAYLIYYSYRDWEFRRSLYYSARAANQSMDPNHELQFKVPGGGYKTVEELKHDYDRAAQRITFSAIATAAVYAASLLVTYSKVEKINESAVPSFEISCSCDRLIDNHGGIIELRFTYRI
jgi:hypothetical protein